MKERAGPGTILALCVLGTCLASRPLAVAGAPQIVKFLHFAVAIGSVALLAPRVSTRVGRSLMRGVVLLAAAIGLSALANGAGVVNALLDFTILAEPFLLLVLLTGSPEEAFGAKTTRRWVYLLGFSNIAAASYQFLAQGLEGDNVRGLFLEQGAGAHVAGAVAMTLGAAVLASPARVWMKVIVGVSCLSVVRFTDSKQVLAVFLVSLLLMAALRAKDLGYALKIGTLGAAAVAITFLAAHTIMPALLIWSSPEVVVEGVGQKLSVLSILNAHADEWWKLLVGMGPGHTVGRLASLLPEYWETVAPLGATVSGVTDAVHRANDGHLLSSTAGSSMWSLFFFWAGLIGDLGLLGLLAFSWLWCVVWRRLCSDGLTRFLVINVIVFGAVFAWLEEPGYMLFVAALLGLAWQDRVLKLTRDHADESLAHPARSVGPDWRLGHALKAMSR